VRRKKSLMLEFEKDQSMESEQLVTHQLEDISRRLNEGLQHHSLNGSSDNFSEVFGDQMKNDRHVSGSLSH